MTSLDYHVLLALSGGPLHGYALKDAIAADSDGSETPRPGTLYRVVARLITAGLVRETEPAEGRTPHPGLARRYYTLTTGGRRALADEAQRLKGTAAVAEKRLNALRTRS
jgi:DNA-binding PadR family transcriptional regulator